MIWIKILRFLVSLTVFVFVLLKSLNISIEKFYVITRKYIPKYKDLINKYDAIYPCVMDHVQTCDSSFERIKGISNLYSFFFIKDNSFVIVSSLDPDIYIEIPFASIIYHNSHILGNYGEKYSFLIDIYFKGIHRTESFAFTTLDYHHKIDGRIHKKNPGMLNDENLYDFICKNFPTEEEYKRKRNLEKSKFDDNFFETSIYHILTNINAE